jgi:hypothetical protein
MFVVRLVDTDIAPKVVLTWVAAEAFAKNAFGDGEADRAEIYEIEGAANVGDTISRFNAGQCSLRRTMSRPLTPKEAEAAAKAEQAMRDDEQARKDLDLL